jgi:osmoprotectant transport system ATP-binding protein
MLLDEPFGALDPLTRDRLQQSFLRIRRRLRLTAIFVTHDMVEALLMGDRIAVMHGGRLVQVGTPAELLHAPADDYVRQLMNTPKRQAELVDGLLATGSPSASGDSGPGTRGLGLGARDSESR